MLRIHLEGESPRILRVEGRLVAAGLEAFESACDEAAAAGSLRIDLAGLTYADALALSALRRRRERGIPMSGCSPFLHELFEELDR